MIGKSTNTPASTPCMANDNAAVHGFRLLRVPLDSNRLSSNIPALLVFTTDTGSSKLAPAIVRDCAAVDSGRTDGLVVRWGFLASNPDSEGACGSSGPHCGTDVPHRKRPRLRHVAGEINR